MSLALSDPLHLWSIISYMWCSMLHRVLDVVHCDGLGVCFCIIWLFHALALRNSDNFRPSLPMISNNWTLSNRFTVRKMNLSRPVHRISKIEECTCCNSRDVRFESSSICKAFWWVLFDGELFNWCSGPTTPSKGIEAFDSKDTGEPSDLKSYNFLRRASAEKLRFQSFWIPNGCSFRELVVARTKDTLRRFQFFNPFPSLFRWTLPLVCSAHNLVHYWDLQKSECSKYEPCTLRLVPQANF